MAKLRPRRGKWYARVRWYDKNGRECEETIPMRTTSKVIAMERLAIVEKVESDIKLGISFTSHGRMIKVRQGWRDLL